jgi:phosphatidylserine/phosphatidylglycerophosphate/cardiolipin synthase-like enzyme
MKKSLFYFLLPVICISTGFYLLNYGQDKKITPATLPAPLEKLVPLPQLIQPAPVPPSNNTQNTAVIPAPKVFEEIQKEKNKPRTAGIRLYPFFSPRDNVRQILIDQIAKETKGIHCAAYRLTDPLITKALLEAYERGIKITLVIDKEGFSATHSKLLYLFSKNIPVFIYPPIIFDREEKKQPREGLMHNKFICFESQETVITGSFNYTKSAQEINQENILIVEDPTTYATYMNQFNYLKTVSSLLQVKDTEGIKHIKKRK